jgi:hypothetical protein
MGINSLGIEAHPFVYWVAKTKLNFELELGRVLVAIHETMEHAHTILTSGVDYQGLWPPLVAKCFTRENLYKLCSLRTAVLESQSSDEIKDLLKLALTATLRTASTAGAGWPYIAPSKYQAKTQERDAFIEFQKQCTLMFSDLQHIQSLQLSKSEHYLINGDARKLHQHARPDSIDLIITSPPYLNNYDYADRTRLETYFWGVYRSWNDITKHVRDRLIIAATTQIRQSTLNGILNCPSIEVVDPRIHRELVEKVNVLIKLRTQKAGKKAYNIMVAAYFEDMIKVIRAAYKVLKPRGQFILVLGDSAPYGIHIPTEEYIGRLAVSSGFSDYSIQILRTRGGKWAHNPQRHTVPLRESILTISK